jgi:thymidylate synthase (FAD)
VDAITPYEIHDHAAAMLVTLKACVFAYRAAFLDYRLGAVTLSAHMLAAVRRMVAGETVTQADSGLNRRERGELMAALGR